MRAGLHGWHQHQALCFSVRTHDLAGLLHAIERVKDVLRLFLDDGESGFVLQLFLALTLNVHSRRQRDTLFGGGEQGLALVVFPGARAGDALTAA